MLNKCINYNNMENNRNEGHYFKNEYTSSEKNKRARKEAEEYSNYINGIEFKSDEELEAEKAPGLLIDFNDKILERILEFTSLGYSIKKVSSIKGMPPADHIRQYKAKNPNFRIEFEKQQQIATSSIIDKHSEFLDDFKDGKSVLSDLGAKVYLGSLESSIKLRDPEKHNTSTKVYNNTQNNILLNEPEKIVVAIKQLSNSLDKRQLIEIQREIARKIDLIEDSEAQTLLN